MTSPSRSINMSHIRGKNTTPELKVRKALHRRGFRYSLNSRRLPGSPDLVLAKYRTCIFVNGCFWHGHDGCRAYTHPKTNPEFWEAKVRRNKERDELVNAKLEALGWYTLTIWECELKRGRFEQTIENVVDALKLNLEAWEAAKKRKAAERIDDAKRRAADREYSKNCDMSYEFDELELYPCDICGEGFPYEEMYELEDGRIICAECLARLEEEE